MSGYPLSTNNLGDQADWKNPNPDVHATEGDVLKRNGQPTQLMYYTVELSPKKLKNHAGHPGYYQVNQSSRLFYVTVQKGRVRFLVSATGKAITVKLLTQAAGAGAPGWTDQTVHPGTSQTFDVGPRLEHSEIVLDSAMWGYENISTGISKLFVIAVGPEDACAPASTCH